MAMTYASLQTQIADYLDRTDQDTLNEIPNFIYQAEQRICRESKTLGIETYVVGTLIGAQSVYPKPARWRRNLTLNYGMGVGNNIRTPLEIRSYEFLRSYWQDPTTTAPPLYYADYGYYNILVAPTPDQDYPFEWGYLELPEPLSTANQTNWLTNYVPDVLLYASLLEAVPYLKDDERVPVWKEYYDRGLASMNIQDDQRVADRGINRSAD